MQLDLFDPATGQASFCWPAQKLGTTMAGSIEAPSDAHFLVEAAELDLVWASAGVEPTNESITWTADDISARVGSSPEIQPHFIIPLAVSMTGSGVDQTAFELLTALDNVAALPIADAVSRSALDHSILSMAGDLRAAGISGKELFDRLRREFPV